MELISESNSDLKKLSEDQLVELQKEISDKLIKIINKANKDANKMLKKYGLETTMVMEIKEKSKE